MVCRMRGRRTYDLRIVWSANCMFSLLFGLRTLRPTVGFDGQCLSIIPHNMKAWLAWSENCHCLRTVWSTDCVVFRLYGLRTVWSADYMVCGLYGLWIIRSADRWVFGLYGLQTDWTFYSKCPSIR